MRTLRFLNVAVLSVLVGGAALVYAQDEKPQEDHPAKQEDAKPQPKQDEAKPPRQDEAKPPKQQEPKNDDKRMQDESRQQNNMDRQGQEHPGQPAEHNQQMEHQGQPMAQGHGAEGNRGRRIPDEQFHARFGHDHHFRAQGVIVAGQSQFQYSGYTFQLVDPWPAGWAYTDDCYIDYIDGEYFLFDLLHPGVRIAVFVIGG